MPKITHEEMKEIDKALPWAGTLGLSVEDIGEGTARVRLPL